MTQQAVDYLKRVVMAEEIHELLINAPSEVEKNWDELITHHEKAELLEKRLMYLRDICQEAINLNNLNN